MGQSYSRQPVPTNVRSGRRQRTSSLGSSRRNEMNATGSWPRIEARSLVHHHDDRLPRAQFDEARPQSIEAILRISRSETQRRAPALLNPDHRRRGQAEAPPSRNKLKIQGKTGRHSFSYSRRDHRHPRRKKTKECGICTDTRSLQRFPSRPPTAQCTHEANVCRRCLRKWIQSQFATKIWDEINCPICSERMKHEDVQEFAPSNVFHRYDILSTRAACEDIPGFRWCIARGCKSGQVQPPGVARFRCMACKKSHCVEHNVAWHKRETCREYDYRTNKKLKRVEEVASKRLILATTKKCPGCKRNIEKNWGCDHMTCAQCKQEFCWQCLVPYAKQSRGRVMHRPGCDHHNPEWASA